MDKVGVDAAAWTGRVERIAERLKTITETRRRPRRKDLMEIFDHFWATLYTIRNTAASSRKKIPVVA